jgi:hypothetical protein
MNAQHMIRQGPMVGTLGRMALEVLRQRLRPTTVDASSPPVTPGPELTETVGPRDPQLVRDYLRWCKADASAWRGTLPPHFFPQWGFPLLARTLTGIPYPLARVLNGGCRLEIAGPIPAGEPLSLSARLEDIDDDGRRAVLHQRLETRTVGGPVALVSHLYAIVPLGERSAGGRGKSGGGKKSGGARPMVPADAREIGQLRLGTDAGFEFACLTGDFNPVHWIRPYGKAAGFGGTILHGFATMSRAIERLNRVVFAGDARALRVVDVRFTRPLRLPARVAVFQRPGEVYVGEAPGAPAYLTGTYET